MLFFFFLNEGMIRMTSMIVSVVLKQCAISAHLSEQISIQQCAGVYLRLAL